MEEKIMDKKQIIIDVLAEVGVRGYMRKLKKTPGFEGMTPSDVAMIYHDMDTLDCPNGKQWKFKSITDGFKSCAKGRKCQCFVDKVSKAKPVKSREDQLKINEKRDATNLKKYGVANIGSTHMAKTAHKKFYSNQENIDNQVAKQEQTMMDRYGYTNYGHSEGNIFKTNHPMKDPEIAKRSGKNRSTTDTKDE